MCVSLSASFSHTHSLSLTLTPSPYTHYYCRYELALNNRIFCSARHNFTADYSDRVESLGQYLKFKHKNGSIAKNLDKKR